MKRIAVLLMAFVLLFSLNSVAFAAEQPSDSQVKKQGGTKENAEDGVTVSKTIEGTELENVFDITLNVTTTTDIKKLTEDPDMAVVVVMDISNTMNEDFDSTDRYSAAMSSFNHFVDLYRQATSTSQTSRIGFVAFNSDAKQIASMTEVKTATQATNFKNTVKNGTRDIIYADGYDHSHNRFTNIEAGLKRGYDMIKNLPNQNKFIVFLSDGFPTTYIKSGYTGYDTYTPNATSYSEGVFYDAKIKVPCSYGTSYSERAAIKARQQATTIKKAGAEIFSIGIDIGGQTIADYDIFTKKDGFSIIDRPNSTSYEIGSATSASAYKNWLKGTATTGIGSGYYYDSTNQSQMDKAFQNIFSEMKQKTEERTAKSWQVADPMGKDTELIGFYDKSGKLVETNITGSNESGGENTATKVSDPAGLNWNVQKSGYSKSGNKFTYILKYRVRLTNEASDFTERKSQDTNGKTTLSYQIITTKDGVPEISPMKTIDFPVPAVEGYLSEFSFVKADDYKNLLTGAEFTLTHDTANCSKCKGNGNAVNVSEQTVASNENGIVTFTKIPSGHKYIMTETKVPENYQADGSTFAVTVAYDVITVAQTKDGVTTQWKMDGTDTVENPKDVFDLQLLKVDAKAGEKEPLKNAEFSLFTDKDCKTPAKHPDGTKVGPIVTDDKGIAAIGIVDIGTYYLREDKAPKGYYPLSDLVVITIDPKGKTIVIAKEGKTELTVKQGEGELKNQYTITIPNKSGEELPLTGGIGTGIYFYGGLVLIMFSAFLYGTRRMNRSR